MGLGNWVLAYFGPDGSAAGPLILLARDACQRSSKVANQFSST